MIFECLNEKIYAEKLENGLQVIIIPKKGGLKKYAAYATHFGSINYQFKVQNEDHVVTVPDGVAHFLEHKLFEQEDGVNALDRLTKMGANPNAYTSFNHTSYLFECTNDFENVLRALIQFVQNPYLTEENVEKEKGIIGQEIQMYDDDPSWQLFFGLLNCLYGGHAITKDIAGTIESIAEITPEILYQCYNTFYDTSNMVLCVCGDVDPEETLSIIKEDTKPQKVFSEIDRYYGDEKDEIHRERMEKKMDVSMPLFSVGFKDLFNKEKLKAGLPSEINETIKYDIAMQILLEMIAGEGTKLYEDLYNEGLVNKELSAEFSAEEDYAFSAISGESKEPDKVVGKILDKIAELKVNGLHEEEFQRTKKMLYGRFVRGFEDVSNIANMFINDFFRGVNAALYVEAYKDIDHEYVENVLNHHFDFGKKAISIIQPKDN
ncbi:MAG: insulinase family protein [Clostridia bacterium]|nr:insulinase family protein [Clostridia bacterium]